MGNWEHRFKVILAVFMIVRDGDKVLLLRRANSGYMDGKFGLPSGHVDGNEPATLAACRELKEEIGIEVAPEDLRPVHTMHEKADGHERLNLGFEVVRYTGSPTIKEPHKCTELLWADLNKLPDDIVPLVRFLLEQIATHKVYSNYGFDT